MSEITDERRRELIEAFDRAIDGCEIKTDDYEQIKAMLEREALPWSIDEMRECITQLGPAATLTADPRRSHEISIKGKYARGFMRRLQRTITGPDEGEGEPNQAEAMRAHQEVWTTPIQPPPTITFRPYEPERPTLDQMPEGEPHAVWNEHSPKQEIRARRGNIAFCVAADGTLIESMGGSAASYFTVLDAPPVEPKTLAEVPDLCLCEQPDGTLCSKWDGRAWMRDRDNLLRYRPSQISPSDIAITRVLGHLQATS